MAFERKQVQKAQPKTTFWTIFKYYYVVIPAIYLIFLMPNAVSVTSTGPRLEPLETFNLIKQLLMLAIGGIIRVIDARELAKSRAGDHFMKMIMAQQLVASNFFGIIVTVLAWNELPRVLRDEQIPEKDLKKWHFKNRTIYILLGIVIALTILTAFGQWKLAPQLLKK